MLVVDYYSRCIEIQKFNSTTAFRVITELKAIFARFGVPATVISDNSPQYASKDMSEFASKYNFHHVMSSLYYSQSNGLAERAVRTTKELFKNSPDPYKALLSYRATPLPSHGFSRAELLMGRKIRTDVPQLNDTFTPRWFYMKQFKQADERNKERH